MLKYRYLKLALLKFKYLILKIMIDHEVIKFFIDYILGATHPKVNK
jgi:hypothetical protein